MGNLRHIHPKQGAQISAFNRRLAIRNIVFVLLISLLYVLAKQYKLAHTQPQQAIVKLK
jgi:uncharacterized membrane protein